MVNLSPPIHAFLFWELLLHHLLWKIFNLRKVVAKKHIKMQDLLLHRIYMLKTEFSRPFLGSAFEGVWGKLGSPQNPYAVFKSFFCFSRRNYLDQDFLVDFATFSNSFLVDWKYMSFQLQGRRKVNILISSSQFCTVAVESGRENDCSCCWLSCLAEGM